MSGPAPAPVDLAAALRTRGLDIQIGPFVVRVRSRIPRVADSLSLFYSEQILSERALFADFHVELTTPQGLRRWFRPQVHFLYDGQRPFKPLPLSHAYAFFEWGLNWCIGTHAHDFLLLHAGAVERGGRAVLLPGPPGSGKSTLCAALVGRGWRLLSDEFGMLSLSDGLLYPLPRPISLKNESIALMRDYAPGAVIGPEATDTQKGTVAHLKPTAQSIARFAEPATPAWIVVPQFRRRAELRLQSRPKARTFMHVATSSFNYSVLGPVGFTAASDLMERCACYELTYSDLDQAVATFDRLASA